MRNLFVCLLLLATIYAKTEAAVLVKDKRWPAASQLNVVFIDGNPKLWQLVETVAPEWVENSSLSFRFFRGWHTAPQQTHIRVSFQSHNGSVLGNHHDFTSKQPTLVLSLLPQLLGDDAAARRLILHEFGHALGFEHEFLSPVWPYGRGSLQAVIEQCVKQMKALQPDSKQALQDCQRLNQPLAKDKVLHTVFDEFSIMNYPLTIQLGQGRTKRIKASSKLSFLDRYAISRWYGKANH